MYSWKAESVIRRGRRKHTTILLLRLVPSSLTRDKVSRLRSSLLGEGWAEPDIASEAAGHGGARTRHGRGAFGGTLRSTLTAR